MDHVLDTQIIEELSFKILRSSLTVLFSEWCNYLQKRVSITTKQAYQTAM